MAKYHVRTDGTVGKCTAQSGNCPLSAEGAIHTDDVTTAREVAEDMLKEKYGSFGSLKKKPETVDTSFNDLVESTLGAEFVVGEDHLASNAGTVDNNVFSVGNDESYSVDPEKAKKQGITEVIDSDFYSGRNTVLSANNNKAAKNIVAELHANTAFSLGIKERSYYMFDALAENNVDEFNAELRVVATDIGLSEDMQSSMFFSDGRKHVLNAETFGLVKRMKDASYSHDDEGLDCFEEHKYSMLESVLSNDNKALYDSARSLSHELQYMNNEFDWVDEEYKNDAAVSIRKLNDWIEG